MLPRGIGAHVYLYPEGRCRIPLTTQICLHGLLDEYDCIQQAQVLLKHHVKYPRALCQPPHQALTEPVEGETKASHFYGGGYNSTSDLTLSLPLALVPPWERQIDP